MGVADGLLLLTALVCIASSQEFLYTHDGAKPLKPGSTTDVSKNDPGVQKAVKTATYYFNNRSNDIFVFRASSIDDAKKQVVKGVKYILEVEISRTVCRKRGHPDPDNCDFQPNGILKQTFRCHFEVWSIPWLHQMETTFFSCVPQQRLFTLER
ncbi:cystatin-F [Amia ocellicauda]|uniref:cystatin-F n=1 Tax=Amia ocellicauda TaxID=2972642 RepID=UPI0034638956